MSNLKEVLKNQEEKSQQVIASKNQGMKQLLTKMRTEIATALPHKITHKAFQNIALSTYNENKNLQCCEPTTFITAMLKSVQLGLEPNTPLGLSYLIPHKENGVNKVQFQIGYKGLIELANRSGKIKSIYANEVRANDTFDIEYGVNQNLTHKPTIFGNRGDVIGYYAVYHIEPDGYNFVYMNKDEVMDHGKKYSRGFEGGLWESEFDSMAKKTVIKKLLKYAPISTEIKQAVVLDESIS